MTTEQTKQLKQIQRELKKEVKTIGKQQRLIDRKFIKLEKMLIKFTS
jgi:hypothetical protein